MTNSSTLSSRRSSRSANATSADRARAAKAQRMTVEAHTQWGAPDEDEARVAVLVVTVRREYRRAA